MPENFLENVLAASVALAVLLLILGVVYAILQAVSVKKKQKYFAELHKELAPGQEVIFGGGIYGTVKEVDGDRVAVKVRSGAVLDVSRYSIQQTDSAGPKPK